MSDYARAVNVTYTRTVANSAASTFKFNPPPGTSRFRVVDINADVTTVFPTTSMTVPAQLGIGVTGNTSIAGALSFGTVGAGASATLALGWASPVAGQASVQSTNATPFNKSTNTNGSSVGGGTTSALITGSNNPVSATLDLGGASSTTNTITTNAASLYNPAVEVLGPAIATFTPATGGATTGGAIVEITLAWF